MQTANLVGGHASVNVQTAKKNDDGAILLNAVVGRSGDYEYYAFELPGFREQGFEFDELVLGRMSKGEAKKVAKQLEGTPITDRHVFIETGDRSEFSVGTMLREGEVDDEGLISSRASIHSPDMIVKVMSGEAEELSIGFRSMVRWRENPSANGPHFDIVDIELNHVAIVEEGRAGPKARLLNHKSTISKENMMKITINGVEHEVSEQVASEFGRLNAAEQQLTNSLTVVTAERDTAQGELATANTSITELQNSAPDDAAITERAAAMSLEHSTFVADAAKLGKDVSKMEMGKYDINAERIKMLNEIGTKMPEDASPAYVSGAWGFAVANPPAKTGISVLDAVDPAEGTTSAEMVHTAVVAEHDYYFGGKSQKKEA